jgi:hypothetical protein
MKRPNVFTALILLCFLSLAGCTASAPGESPSPEPTGGETGAQNAVVQVTGIEGDTVTYDFCEYIEGGRRFL